MATLVAPSGAAPRRAAALAVRCRRVRDTTVQLCTPLTVEDHVVSSMLDVSPTKWHLAHTSWFFETFVLGPYLPGYRSPNPRYAYLFNSYYTQAGERHCRAQRGLVTRPTVAEVLVYRAHVDDALERLLEAIGGDDAHPVLPIIELGLHHEQQHQELLLTDIKHVFFTNPLLPAYLDAPLAPVPASEQGWVPIPSGVHEIGHAGEGFAFDNEAPRHRVWLEGGALADRLVTNAEYAAFVEDGGYARPELWLSAGFATVQEQRWEAPLYWMRVDGAWHEFTLAGLHPLDPHAPVTHVSHHEADAYARWASARLPLEAEWEVVAATQPLTGRFSDARRFHPGGDAGTGLRQLVGDAWQWTSSAYLGYPGYRPAPGAIGEYNGKFMSDQWVLRGASCATPASHARWTYRNFFPSDARWQFTGIRLARDPR